MNIILLVVQKQHVIKLYLLFGKLYNYINVFKYSYRTVILKTKVVQMLHQAKIIISQTITTQN